MAKKIIKESAKPAGSPKKEEAKAAAPKAEVPKAAAPKEPKEKPIPREARVSFDRWFRSKKFKAHWKAGMVAFTNVGGKKTVAEWDKVFETY